jgi:hypothetical protein
MSKISIKIAQKDEITTPKINQQWNQQTFMNPTILNLADKSKE